MSESSLNLRLGLIWDTLLSTSAAANPILLNSAALIPVCFCISFKVRIPCGLILNDFVFSSKYVNCFATLARLSCNAPGSLIASFINENGSTRAPAATPSLWNADAALIASSGSIILSAKSRETLMSTLSWDALAAILVNPWTPPSKLNLLSAEASWTTFSITSLVFNPKSLTVLTDFSNSPPTTPNWIPTSVNLVTIDPISTPITLVVAYSLATLSAEANVCLFVASAIATIALVVSWKSAPSLFILGAASLTAVIISPTLALEPANAAVISLAAWVICCAAPINALELISASFLNSSPYWFVVDLSAIKMFSYK